MLSPTLQLKFNKAMSLKSATPLKLNKEIQLGSKKNIWAKAHF